MKAFKIQNKVIGEGCPSFIIAEVGINHNGDLGIAKKMIRIAKASGADAVKFQTFKASEFINDSKKTYTYKSQGKIVKESMLGMFKRYEFGREDFRIIYDYCKKTGIIFFSTPQNVSDLKILLDIGVPLIKVGSDDLTNLPLLKFYAMQKLPIIISTGMSYFEEVKEAVDLIKKYNNRLAILHCISSYPAGYEELNLSRIGTLKSKFPDAIIGFSDHSAGIMPSICAVMLGAKIIEKHFTLNKNMKGPDHRFSMDPKELASMVDGIRAMEKAIGVAHIYPSKKEMKMRRLCRRSLVAATHIKKGKILEERDLAAKRPGTGILPKDMHLLIGRMAKKDIAQDKMISLKDVA